jgi:hypothetical protein
MNFQNNYNKTWKYFCAQSQDKFWNWKKAKSERNNRKIKKGNFACPMDFEMSNFYYQVYLSQKDVTEIDFSQNG